MTIETKTSYVQQRIVEALLCLMRQYPFGEISITQIVQTAEVGRASFYRNFKDKEDVLRQYMRFLIRKWGRKFEEIGKPNVIESLLEHFYGEREFYQLLCDCGVSYYMLDTIKEACCIAEEGENIQAYMKAWFAGGLFCWIEEWIKRGMKETPEEMLRLLSLYESSRG